VTPNPSLPADAQKAAPSERACTQALEPTYVFQSRTHRLAVRATHAVLCASLSACSSVVAPLEHSVEWKGVGTTAVLTCTKSPTDVCYFLIQSTNMAPPQVLRTAAGESVSVSLGSQGATYCASDSPPRPQECEMQVLTGGFHYHRAPPK
jgi:hypothetical protein